MGRTTMRAVAIIPATRAVSLVEHPVPQVERAHDVKVRSLDVGICGTDREIAAFVYGTPPAGSSYLILGHENVGEVVEVGSSVTGLRPGDLVVPSVRRPCAHGHCTPCSAHLQDFCTTGDFTERGIKEQHGFMTEWYVDDARYLSRIDRSLGDVAVLIEPLTIAEKALAQIELIQRRLPWSAPDRALGAGRRAVVIGAGPVGLLGAMALITRGFDTYVYSRSRMPNPKAELAQAIGATYISSLDTPAAALGAQLGQIDVVYEAAGVASVAYDVLNVLGINGIYVFTGIPLPGSPIPIDADGIMRNVVLKNQVVLGTVNADPAAFDTALQDLQEFERRWPEPLRRIITGRHAPDAFDRLLRGTPAGIKELIRMT